MRVELVGAELEENLAIRYLRAALERAGHEVGETRFDGPEDLEGAARRLASSGARLAGLSMVFTYRARQFALLAARAREMGFRGHLTAGGHFAAFNAESLLRDVPSLDSVVVGEGEETIRELSARIADIGAVRGLVWRDASGRIVRNEPAEKPPDLDSLPEPARVEPFDSYLGLPIANVLSSRGCTHSCSFCSIAAWHRLCGGPRFRARDPERVADELARLWERGVRIFNFHDDNFFLCSAEASGARVRALGAALARRGVRRIAFAVKSRPGSVDEDLFLELKRMGLFRVFLGIEAGTAESLRRLGRGQTPSENERALAIVNRLDLHSCFNLLLINPDSTLEDLAANVDFLRRHPSNPMNFCRTEIYSGTPLEAKLRREGRLLGDYWGHDYRVADPRAEGAFRLLHAAFWERNHGDRSPHRQTMRVDYEHQLLAHFHGTAPDLRRRVKAYIAAVNIDTCSLLDEWLEVAATGMREASGERVAREMKARIDAGSTVLWAEGERLLLEIRSRALVGSRGAPRWRRVAAAAGVAAVLGLSGASCQKATHPFEMEAPPTQAAHDLRAQVAKEILPRIAARLPTPRAIVVSLTLDASGKVSSLEVSHEGAVVDGALPPGEISLGGASGRAGSSSFEFSEEEVRAAKAAADVGPPGKPPGEGPGVHPHPEEMVPAPDGGLRPPPESPDAEPPTHMFEMAPVPPAGEKSDREGPRSPESPEAEPPTHMFEAVPAPPGDEEGQG